MVLQGYEAGVAWAGGWQGLGALGWAATSTRWEVVEQGEGFHPDGHPVPESDSFKRPCSRES